MRGLIFGVWSALAATIAGSSCIVELDHAIVCGDGYIDDEAGEECEPGMAAPTAEVCAAQGIVGLPSCDSDTCTIRCVGCGDGVVQETSVDGLLAEECDEGPYPGDGAKATAPRACAELGDPLDPWRPELPYASGMSTRCTASCFYDRSTCSYCGNGSAEDSWPLAPEFAGQDGVYSFAENCDGDDLSAEFLATAGCQPGTEPNVVCQSDCQSTTPRGGASCCVSAGSPCDDPALCCHAYAHPGDTFHCENPLTGEPVGDEPPVGGGSTCR